MNKTILITGILSVFFIFSFGAILILQKNKIMPKTSVTQNANTNFSALRAELTPLQSTIRAGGMVMSPENNKIRAITFLRDPALNSQVLPVIITKGSCNDIGEVAYTLPAIKNGKSDTYLTTSLGDITSKFPLSLKIYKSLQDHTVVFCGEIKGE